MGILEVDSGQLFLCFGHWNGTLLTDVETVLQWAKTMTWKGPHPLVQWVTTTYERGKRLGPAAKGTRRRYTIQPSVTRSHNRRSVRK